MPAVAVMVASLLKGGHDVAAMKLREEMWRAVKSGKFIAVTAGGIAIEAVVDPNHHVPTHVYTHIGRCSGYHNRVTLRCPNGGPAISHERWHENVGPASGSGFEWVANGRPLHGHEHTGDAWEGGGDRSWGSEDAVRAAVAERLLAVEGIAAADTDTRDAFFRSLPLCDGLVPLTRGTK